MSNVTKGATFIAIMGTFMSGAMATEALSGQRNHSLTHTTPFSPEFMPLEPRSEKQARSRPDSAQWRTAELTEMETLVKMGTFEVVDRPEKYDPLPLKYVYTLKVQDGDFDNAKRKARLVLQGNLQYEDEYNETYTPTARLSNVRMVTSIAAQQKLRLKKFDLSGAFLVADMDRVLYVTIPGQELPDGKAFLLKKALYGGKQSGALYNQEITGWLLDYGFTYTSTDNTLFTLDRNGGKIMLSLYIDDGLCATNNEALYADFLKALGNKYQLSDHGNLDWHLGMKFTTDNASGKITIDQSAYVEAMLRRFGMDEHTTSKPTPMIPHTHLTKDDCPDVPDKKRTKLYQQLIGSLMYIACGTRPDISAAVSQCSQFMSNPGEAHVVAAKHILRYLKGTANVGLTYGGSNKCSANTLYGYVDADHAGCADDRRSVGG